jgi:enoyl-CoA hydratase/carnithine racemase
MRQAVEFELHGQLCIIRLKRPEVHNTVNADVIRALENTLKDLRHRPGIRFLILTGAGRETFCAGALSYFATLKSPFAAELSFE